MNNLRAIQIFCTYFENYNFDGDTPYYKIKGSHVFECEVNFNDLMYRQDELRSILNDKIHRETNPTNSPQACKYIIDSIELKDEVTHFGVINTEDINHYPIPQEERFPNKINPGLCSPAANQYLMEKCRDQRGYRDQAIDYMDIKNCM
tara:strand:+ start:82 stop:525 length:444 start_codon:yes stop_codon:yes gene_type:complete